MKKLEQDVPRCKKR